jgi:Ran GTPase-activating protein (RanGAP) involved in mRNA processing and transport
MLRSNKTLTHIDLERNAVGTEGAKLLAQVLQSHPSLKRIDIESDHRLTVQR